MVIDGVFLCNVKDRLNVENEKHRTKDRTLSNIKLESGFLTL